MEQGKQHQLARHSAMPGICKRRHNSNGSFSIQARKHSNKGWPPYAGSHTLSSQPKTRFCF